jgi:hypothetical protein
MDEAGQALLLQGPDGKLDGGLVIRDDRMAIRGLITGQYQCVQGQRILLWSGQLFFDQAAEDPDLLG